MTVIKNHRLATGNIVATCSGKGIGKWSKLSMSFGMHQQGSSATQILALLTSRSEQVPGGPGQNSRRCLTRKRGHPVCGGRGYSST